MIRRLSNVITEQLQPSGLLLWMLSFCAGASLVAFSVVGPGFLHLSLLFALVLLAVGYRHYMTWRHMRLQRSLVPVRVKRKTNGFK